MKTTYLKVEERLTEPVVHDGDLGCVVPQRLPDAPGHDCLDQEAEHQDGQVVWPQQQCCQEDQPAVQFPQARGPDFGVCSGDLGSQQVSGAREQNAKDKDVNKTSFDNTPGKGKANELR